MDFNSEAELVQFFISQLTLGKAAQLGPFEIVAEEVSCKQGITDVIAVKKPLNSNSMEALYSCSSLNEASGVLGVLKGQSPRTHSYLLESTAVSKKSVSKIIQELLSRSLIKEISEGKYVSTVANEIEKTEIWSFEAKLSNWKRALFQAAQHVAFSTYSYMVIPKCKEKLIIKNSATIRHYGVGVISCSKNGDIDIVIRAKRNNRIVKCDVLFVLGKCCSTKNSDKRLHE